MRLAIHLSPGTFSDRWKAYCESHRVPYVGVDCLSTTIMQELAGVDGLLWHWRHQDAAEILSARHIVLAAEIQGLVVFPSTATCWHFDDKIAQKYLLEAVGAPLAPTYVFYSLDDAGRWIRKASFPKVFKLRKGAGSTNVRLVHDREEALALANTAFTGGFRPVPSYWNDAQKRYRAASRNRQLLNAVRRVPATLRNIRHLNRAIGRERAYIYFQDFLPDNQFDTRITVIGDRAFGYIRKVRPGDFRASGSGQIDYDPANIRIECVQIAFEVARNIASQSTAFDFVIDRENQPKIVEVSYCYVPEFVYNCPGQWDSKLKWHAGHVWPEEAILIDLMAAAAQRNSPPWALQSPKRNAAS